MVAAAEHGAAETPREMELLAAAMRAGEDAATAREAATAAEGHAAHYRAIAEANDAAIKEMQTAFDALKTESERAKADRTRRRVGGAQPARASEAETSAASRSSALRTPRRRLRSWTTPARRQRRRRRLAAEAEQNAAAAEGRVAALAADVEEHRKQWRQAQQMYEQALLHRPRRTSRSSTRRSRGARRRRRRSRRSGAGESGGRFDFAAAESKWADERGSMEKARRDAEAKTAALGPRTGSSTTSWRTRSRRPRLATAQAQPAARTRRSASRGDRLFAFRAARRRRARARGCLARVVQVEARGGDGSASGACRLAPP